MNEWGRAVADVAAANIEVLYRPLWILSRKRSWPI